MGWSASCKGDIEKGGHSCRDQFSVIKRHAPEGISRAHFNRKNCSYACTIEKNEGHVVEVSSTLSSFGLSFSLSPTSTCISPPFPILYLWPQRESTWVKKTWFFKKRIYTIYLTLTNEIYIWLYAGIFINLLRKKFDIDR